MSQPWEFFITGTDKGETKVKPEVFKDPEKFKASGLAARAGYSYHNQWWIAHDAAGSFEAKGLNGQHIHINPKAELVIVKLSSHVVGNTLVTHVQDRRAFEAISKALQ